MNSCQGQVFKASVGHYRAARGFGFKVSLVVAKRRSCPGCPDCAWQVDALGDVGNDWPILGIEKAVDGAFYRLEIGNVMRDFESGIVDGVDLRLVACLPPIEDLERLV